MYKWLVETGKALSYYNDKVVIKKEVPLTARESGEKKAAMSESQKEVTKLQTTIKERERTIEELREENETLRSSQVKTKAELKQFQVCFVGGYN